MRTHRPAADSPARAFQEPVWSVDPSRSPPLERRAAHLLSHLNRVRVGGALRRLEDLLVSTSPVYCREVAMASQIVSEGARPLYVPRRRGELRDRVAKVLAALRGAS